MIHRAQSLSLAAGLLILGGAGSATAQAVYDYSSVVTLCTGTCTSFASLDIGSTVQGDIEIASTASGSFDDSDILGFQFSIENPALPLSGPVGDPVNDNPQIVESALGTAQSTGSSITTDASNEIVDGTLLIELLVPPWSSNGAYLIFDLATGDGQLCLFYATAGCIPGATQAVQFEGAFQNVPEPTMAWMLGPAVGLLAALGSARRRRASRRRAPDGQRSRFPS